MTQATPFSYEYNTSEIRKLLLTAFSDQDFSIFCYDHFPVVYKDFTEGMRLATKVQLLVDYCNRTNSFDNLLSLVKEVNPNQYNIFGGSLKKTRVDQQTDEAVPRKILQPSVTQIFLSYSRKDIDTARRLAEDLQQAGFAVWWDVSDLKGGDSWGRTIQAALEASKYCLVLLSPDSVQSEWVENEYQYALELGLKVIPLFYRDCRKPLALINKQYIDFRGENYENGLQKLLTSISSNQVSQAIEIASMPKRVLTTPSPTPKSSSASPTPGKKISPWLGIGLVVAVIVIIIAISTQQASIRNQQATAIAFATDRAKATATAAFFATSNAVLATIQAQPTPTPIPVFSGRIAFVSDRDGNSDIYVIADGVNPINLTNDQEDANGAPAWSPDGTRIVFNKSNFLGFTNDRPDFGPSEIYVMDANGMDRINLTKNEASYGSNPAWSPDGTRITFSGYITDSSAVRPLSPLSEIYVSNTAVEFCPSGSIYVMKADGTNFIELTDEGACRASPAWSPDGVRIAFNSVYNEIYVINADGSNPVELTNNTNTLVYDFSPAWSPDGKRIVFSSNRDGNYEIYVMDANGLNPINLTNNQADDISPAWSPDGKRIVFSSNRDGNYEIYVMDANGLNPINLTNNQANDSEPAWAP
jgi:Tol biopolymer transport system component